MSRRLLPAAAALAAGDADAVAGFDQAGPDRARVGHDEIVVFAQRIRDAGELPARVLRCRFEDVHPRTPFFRYSARPMSATSK
mgnify:CR=1 FL=1